MADLEQAGSMVRMMYKDFGMIEISTSPNPIPGSAAVMGNGDNMQCLWGDSVHNRIGVAMDEQLTGIVVCGCAHGRMVAGHAQGAMHFVSEIRCINPAGLSGIPASSLNKFGAGQRFEYDLHLLCAEITASISLNTSSAGIHCVRPASMSSTRRAISSSQALAMTSGDSVLRRRSVGAIALCVVQGCHAR